jgi:hypothetical protein
VSRGSGSPALEGLVPRGRFFCSPMVEPRTRGGTWGTCEAIVIVEPYRAEPPGRRARSCNPHATWVPGSRPSPMAVALAGLHEHIRPPSTQGHASIHPGLQKIVLSGRALSGRLRSIRTSLNTHIETAVTVASLSDHWLCAEGIVTTVVISSTKHATSPASCRHTFLRIMWQEERNGHTCNLDFFPLPITHFLFPISCFPSTDRTTDYGGTL